MRREERTMNPGVTVLSSHEIMREELKGVLLKAGGIYDPGGGTFGLIVQGEQCIWIHANKDSLQKHTAGFLNVLKHDQPDVLEEIWVKLGGEPRTYFEIEIRRTPGSQQLALDFAIVLAETWPCVFVYLPPPRGIVISKEDLLQLRMEGKGLIADEM
jgi:hypothetical protein